jgi:GT2 family glycosyltransferase
MQERPRISVVVPARDDGPLLAECLAALRNGAASEQLEVVVVDDGSTDTTPTVAQSQGARLIQLAGRGPAAARNAGARAARGELLVFLDADCAPEHGCVDALVAPFDDPAVVGVRGGYTSRQRSPVARFTQLELEEKQARLAASPRIAVVDTACAAYRRDVFLEHGGFDERFPATSAEDVELSFRLAQEGARLVYAPGARVRHRHPTQLGHYLWRKLRFGFFRALLYGRYPERLRDDGYTPRLMPLQIGLAGLLSLTTLVGSWWVEARRLVPAVSGAFLLTSLPLVRRAWRSDRGLAVLVPPLLLGRSLAQGLGLSAGLVALAVQRLREAACRPTDHQGP